MITQPDGDPCGKCSSNGDGACIFVIWLLESDSASFSQLCADSQNAGQSNEEIDTFLRAKGCSDDDIKEAHAIFEGCLATLRDENDVFTNSYAKHFV